MFKKKPTIHHMPLADYIEHEPKSDCICGPEECEDDAMKWFNHFSLDGREFRKKNG